MWFGVTILFTGIVAAVLVGLLSGSMGGWRGQVDRATTFVGYRFADVWDDPAARNHLARSAAEQLELGIELRDARGQVLARFGESCGRFGGQFEAPVQRAGDRLGVVHACTPAGTPVGGQAVVVGLLAALMVLWAASGLIAWRLTRPLGRLVKVTRDLGQGHLDARVVHPGSDELGVLGRAFNDMADRIGRQIADQRELLAVVSHEIRTPLGHMRVLLDLARAHGPGAIDEVEQELLEVDRLVDQLLASSRLEFEQVDRRPLAAEAVAARALARAELPAELLVVESSDVRLWGDATLLARALANLVGNAQTHGGGLTALRVEQHDTMVGFVAEDRGPGLPREHRERMFESFVRGGEDGKLGLGLALVQRIAVAHGGQAFAEDGPDTGARVGLWIDASEPVVARPGDRLATDESSPS